MGSTTNVYYGSGSGQNSVEIETGSGKGAPCGGTCSAKHAEHA